MGNQARGLPKLSMPDGRAFLAETVCTAGPAFSSFLFRLLRAPALMRSRQHLSYLIDPSASTESVKAGFHEPGSGLLILPHPFVEPHVRACRETIPW